MKALGKSFGGLRIAALVTALCGLMAACASVEQAKGPPVVGERPVLEAIIVRSAAGGATEIELTTSGEAMFTSFTTPDKKRLFIDVKASRGPGLKELPQAPRPHVTSLSLSEVPGEENLLRLVADLGEGVKSSVVRQDRKILALLQGSEDSQTPRPGLARLLDLDFTVLEKGTSRLTLTTDREVKYQVERTGEKKILIGLDKTEVPADVKERIKTIRPTPPLDAVSTQYLVSQERLGILLELKEIVPYHITQKAGTIRLDLSAPSSKAPRIKAQTASAKEESNTLSKARSEQTPREESKAQLKSQNTKEEKPEQVAKESEKALMPGLQRGHYTGQRMTMDFVNADVTNVLRLIGEVSNLNIVWGPDVKGTVSMRLKNVPWDQALDLVIANNDLGMRRQGNVIWVTTRSRLIQVEEEEKRKREEEAAARAKEIKAAEEAKKSEPLVTEYITLDFAKATEIKDHVEKVKSERGSVSVDERTNTIILKDTQQVVEEARKLARRFDEPVKQIMIEARIVDASTNFSRDLGVKWGSVDGTKPGFDRRWRKHESQGWVTDPTQFRTYGDMIVGGTFSSNTPTDWASNLGLSFSRLTNRGLGILALDASLALAETDGQVKIISAPKVMASNGEKAVISRGDIIYKEIVTADQRDVKELEATLSLTVTPTVSFNDFVTMEVEVTDDKANPDLSGKTAKTIKTKLMVRSGDTLVIGGIFKEDKSESTAGIPWLMDVPVLGWAFKAKKIGMGKTELLVFLTPRVVPAPSVRQ
jgi:type IV pilus assembly protein PilQ